MPGAQPGHFQKPSPFPPQHPIVILKDVAFEDLQTVVKFMYHGIVNVSSDKLPAVLKVNRTTDFPSKSFFPDCGCLADKRPGEEQWADGSLPHWQVLLFPDLVTKPWINCPPSSPRGLLSVPGQVRQPSTESLPEYLHQSAMQVLQSWIGTSCDRSIPALSFWWWLISTPSTLCRITGFELRLSTGVVPAQTGVVPARNQC